MDIQRQSLNSGLEDVTWLYALVNVGHVAYYKEKVNYLLCSLSRVVISIVSAASCKPFTKAEFSIQWEWIQWEIHKRLPWQMSANCQSSPVWIQNISQDCRALEKEMHRWIEKEWIKLKSIEKIFPASPWWANANYKRKAVQKFPHSQLDQIFILTILS